jgi:hypothetical protein
VEFHPECERWAEALGQGDAEALLAAIQVLREEGPSLGRPLVDRIRGSAFQNMKELRPGSTGRSELRVLFAFDRKRQAILLIGGDKSRDWAGWYEKNIPIADERFRAHQAQIGAREKSAGGTKRRRSRKKEKGR